MIIDERGKRPPRFAPIFDTARALFWNRSEEYPVNVDKGGQVERFLKRSVGKCSPKTGWDGLESPGHFDFVGAIASERHEYHTILSLMATPGLADMVARLFMGEFQGLFSPLRQEFVLRCLSIRRPRMADVVRA